MKDLYKTREESKKHGMKYYYTSIPCRNNHVDKRYTSTGICYECKRQQMSRDYSNHKDRVKHINKKSYVCNKEKRNSASQKWAEQNRERSNAIKQNWKIRNRDRHLQMARDYVKTKRLDPIYRMSCAVSLGIWKSLKNKKNGSNWQNLVNFSLDELKVHLEKKFTQEMNWENYGTMWHIDHIKPKSKCNSFEETWDINNLQPLDAKENLRKWNKYE